MHPLLILKLWLLAPKYWGQVSEKPLYFGQKLTQPYHVGKNPMGKRPFKGEKVFQYVLVWNSKESVEGGGSLPSLEEFSSWK